MGCKRATHAWVWALFVFVCGARSTLAGSELALTPEQELIRAMTLCPEPNNPIVNGMRALGGNLIVNVHIDRTGGSVYPVILTADVIKSSHALDTRNDLPDSFRGKIRVEIGYRHATDDKHRMFYCRLQILPAAS